MGCAATTTIRERLECLAAVLAIDDPVSNRHVVDALGAVASLEQLVEAAQQAKAFLDLAYKPSIALPTRMAFIRNAQDTLAAALSFRACLYVLIAGGFLMGLLAGYAIWGVS